MELIWQLSDGAKLGILYLGTLSPSTPSFIWSKIDASAPAAPHLMPSFKDTIQMLHLALLLASTGQSCVDPHPSIVAPERQVTGLLVGACWGRCSEG